jgi:hypothetical protein
MCDPSEKAARRLNNVLICIFQEVSFSQDLYGVFTGSFKSSFSAGADFIFALEVCRLMSFRELMLPVPLLIYCSFSFENFSSHTAPRLLRLYAYPDSILSQITARSKRQEVNGPILMIDTAGSNGVYWLYIEDFAGGQAQDEYLKL